MSQYDVAGVYRIKHKESDRSYIGQSIDVMGRWRAHIRNAYQPQPTSSIAYAIKREGPEAFTFSIEARMDGTLSSKYLTRLLKEKEVELVAHYDSHHNGYNCDDGGNTGNTWRGDYVAPNNKLF